MEKKDKYQSINQKINRSVRYYRVPSSVEKSAALNSLLSKINSEPVGKPRKTAIYPWIRYAAVLIPAALVIFAMLLYVTWGTHTNSGHEVMSFRLPDHSRVVLAPEATVSYNRLFNKRKLSLRGEGYFEVKTGNPFHVVTKSGKVKVLGHAFWLPKQTKA
jgi:transmembrane sensor